MTLLDTPEGKRAVEAMAGTPYTEACSRAGEEGHQCHQCTRAWMWDNAERDLKLALPSIRKALAEELRKAAEQCDARQAWRRAEFLCDAAQFIEEGT